MSENHESPLGEQPDPVDLESVETKLQPNDELTVENHSDVSSSFRKWFAASGRAWLGGAALGLALGAGLMSALSMLGYIPSKDASKPVSAKLTSHPAADSATQASAPVREQVSPHGTAGAGDAAGKNAHQFALSQGNRPAAGQQTTEQDTQTETAREAAAKQANTKKTSPELEQTFSKAAEALANGDLVMAEKAGIEKLPITKPEELALRGKFRFRRYLEMQTLANQEVNPQDPGIKAAIADLVKANTAEAYLELVEVYLQTGDLDQAAKTAKEGQAKFGDRRFNTAVMEIRLEKAQPKKARPPESTLRRMLGDTVLALVLLPTVGPDDSVEDNLMTDDLLQSALTQALDRQDLGEAIRTLDTAVKRAEQLAGPSSLRPIFSPNHDRHKRLIKNLCGHLKAAWEAQILFAKNEKKYLPAGDLTAADLLKAVAGALADAKHAEPFRQIVTKLASGKFIGKPEEVLNGEAAELLNSVDDMIAALQDIRAHIVDQKFTDSAQLPKVVAGVRDAVRIAQMKDPNAVILGLENQVKVSRRAAEMMPVYLKTLQDRDTGLEEIARHDAERVSLDTAATATDIADANVVQALADRNDGKYREATLLVEKALPHLEKSSAFAKVGAMVLNEANDPGGYILRRAVLLQSQGRTDAAIQLLQRSMESVQVNVKPHLLARCALLNVDQLLRRAKGRTASADPFLEIAKRDAVAAGECAEAKYVLGRIAEEIEGPGAAAPFYREAIALSTNLAYPEAEASYRMALIQVLISPGRGLSASGQPTQWTEPGGVGRLNAFDLGSVLALTTVALQPSVADDGPLPTKSMPQNGKQHESTLVAGVPSLYRAGGKAPIAAAYAEAQAEGTLDTPWRGEIMQHANAILAQGDTAPSTARALALAVKGQWTDGLLAYAEGIRAQLPGEHAKGLSFLVANHPLLKQVNADPASAEVLYWQGVGLYFEHDYADAERLLTRSVEASNQNALAHYFQGLARLKQGKTGIAYKSFESGARVERAGKPGEDAIALALERVQGKDRVILGWFRNRVEP